MTYIPTQTGFMQLRDSARLLHVVFPNYPELQPCHPVPVLEVAGSCDSSASLNAVIKEESGLPHDRRLRGFHFSGSVHVV